MYLSLETTHTEVLTITHVAFPGIWMISYERFLVGEITGPNDGKNFMTLIGFSQTIFPKDPSNI